MHIHRTTGCEHHDASSHRLQGRGCPAGPELAAAAPPWQDRRLPRGGQGLEQAEPRAGRPVHGVDCRAGHAAHQVCADDHARSFYGGDGDSCGGALSRLDPTPSGLRGPRRWPRHPAVASRSHVAHAVGPVTPLCIAQTSPGRDPVTGLTVVTAFAQSSPDRDPASQLKLGVPILAHLIPPKYHRETP